MEGREKPLVLSREEFEEYKKTAPRPRRLSSGEFSALIKAFGIRAGADARVEGGQYFQAWEGTPLAPAWEAGFVEGWRLGVDGPVSGFPGFRLTV